MIFSVDHATSEGAVDEIGERLLRPFWFGKASGSRALSIRYPSTRSSPRLVARVHNVFACSQAATLSRFQELSKFRVGM
jgi:hypothetical protein